MSEATSGGPSAEGRDDIPVPAPKVCSECGRPAKRITRTKCNACYERARHGKGLRKWPPLPPEITDLLLPVPGTSQTFARRVFSYVDFGDCWEWTGTLGAYGYGVIGRGVRGSGNMPAHHAVWEMLVGPIPAEMNYDHLCKNHACVNPDHAEIVTPAVNTSRGWRPKMFKARMVCEFGHPLDGRRRSKKRDGQRHCKTCNRERMRAA